MDKPTPFSLPLMLSEFCSRCLMQDIIVIGRFSGLNRLQRLEQTTASTNMFTNLFIEYPWSECFIQRFYAAGKDKRKMSETVHTGNHTRRRISGIIMVFVGSILQTSIRINGYTMMINLSTYMRIYFMGMPFLCL